jgi:four helix bundle protein
MASRLSCIAENAHPARREVREARLFDRARSMELARRPVHEQRSPQAASVQVRRDLALTVYKATSGMAAEERYGLRAQLRRAAVSAATNIVEGSARATGREYSRFLEIAHASARECSYLTSLAARLDLMPANVARSIGEDYDRLAASLLAAAHAIARAPDRTPP